MQWLAQRQRERRWWTASASVAICGLVLGVIGIVPAFADIQVASCQAVVTDGSVTVAWHDVPEGLALTVLAQDAEGALSPVGSDRPIAGFGPTGSWTGDAYPGAVAYVIHGDPRDGGGTLRCDDPVTDSSAAISVGADVGPTVGAGDSIGTPPRIEAAVAVDCYGESVLVDLANLGDVIGVAEIVADGVIVETVTVAPGRTETVAAGVPLVGTTVEVFVGGVVVAASTLDDPCATQAPDIGADVGIDCAADAVTVTVTNDGDGLGVVTVDIGGERTRMEIEPGATDAVTADRNGRTEVPVTVRAGDETILTTTVDGSCAEPVPELSALIALVCDATAPSVRVVVTNDGNTPGSVTVDVDGSQTRIVVAAGSTESTMIVLPGPGPVEVVVRDAAGEILAGLTKQSPCEIPEAEITATAALECVAGQFRVTVANTGDVDGAATVQIGDTTQRVVVAAAGRVDVTADVVAGATVRIRVTDGQRSLLDETFTAVCDASAPALRAEVVRDCDSGEVRVVVTNDGDAAGAAALVYGQHTTTVRVGPGTSVDEYFPLAAATETVRVTGPTGDRTILVEARVDPCGAAAPLLRAEGQVDCRLGEVVVSILNDGDAAGTVTWTVNDRSETAVVAPGAELVVSEPVIAGMTNSWSVSAGGATIAGAEEVEACRPATPVVDAELFVDCGNDEIVVRVSNSGAVDGAARVVIDGDPSDVSVPAGDLVVVRGDLSTDGSYLVDVSSDGTSILTEQGTATECLLPPEEDLVASVAFSCRWNEAIVRVENASTERREVTITIDGDAETIAIPPDDDIELTVPLIEDQPYEIAVVDEDGQSLAFARGVHDCVDIGGATVTDPDPPTTITTTTPMRLPSTGANSGVLAGAGMVFVAAGLLAVRASQFRRDRTATG